jgi:hypothetical protein
MKSLLAICSRQNFGVIHDCFTHIHGCQPSLLTCSSCFQSCNHIHPLLTTLKSIQRNSWAQGPLPSPLGPLHLSALLHTQTFTLLLSGLPWDICIFFAFCLSPPQIQTLSSFTSFGPLSNATSSLKFPQNCHCSSTQSYKDSSLLSCFIFCHGVNHDQTTMHLP